ncbi:MAG: hypothetical protein N4A40_12610 [Tissierellales bacterium]|nr:hypothetical protein [Tissierellales bacterium]
MTQARIKKSQLLSYVVLTILLILVWRHIGSGEDINSDKYQNSIQGKAIESNSQKLKHIMKRVSGQQRMILKISLG